MQVKIELAPEYSPPHAVIYTDCLSPEIQRTLEILQAKDAPIIAEREGRMYLLSPQEIYMVRIEDGEAAIYTNRERYTARKRLYELLEQLGGGFMQISKSCVVHLDLIQSVEASFGGSLLLKLKNGCSDYVSRKYLPGFKTYLGL